MKYLIKLLLSAFYPVVTAVFKLPIVKSRDETLDKILSDNCSIVRYGDGEILMLIDKKSLAFQRYNESLATRMADILLSDDPDILVGLPTGYHSLRGIIPASRLFWKVQVVWAYPRFRKLLNLNKTYYNASITRVYYEVEDKSVCRSHFEKFMRIWHGKRVLLIEGEKSRLGVGNNLFSTALSVERILAPMHDAYEQYDRLLTEALKHDRAKLVLVSLGPTATVLAFDLAKKGFQSLDIGNIDIEYEWYLRGVKGVVKIPGKYTSEAKGGREVEDISDETYDKQIIARVL